ncbi:hypothetical protein KP509_23G040000 [Ceratopteris richardii]|uniref:Uncharacterized protein n=1 Tax=Ceratopteris richardii TaxID=49495 RepID=A0A8T2S0U4_CERRI|nr:hypothetical protein KP509_23G040000 [Ceratopteris richardii]
MLVETLKDQCDSTWKTVCKGFKIPRLFLSMSATCDWKSCMILTSINNKATTSCLQGVGTSHLGSDGLEKFHHEFPLVVMLHMQRNKMGMHRAFLRSF